VVTHFLPHLNRASIWRILRSEGLSRRRLPVSTQPARGQGVFRDYDLGFIHIDSKHLPKLQTADGEQRKRSLFVAIDRRSRSVHLVERFNGRIASEVLGITIYSHCDLEQRLHGFNAAYNARRQRVLSGRTPDQVVAERLHAKPRLATPKGKRHGRSEPDDIAKARLIAEAAKEVSQPDS
jgi:hypothetical protein